MKKDMSHDHAPHAIKARLHAGPDDTYIKEWVYGGIDGVVTTFAVIAGVIGAQLSPLIVMVIGLASLFSDGFSMAAGCYSATKTDEDNYKRLHDFELQSIQSHPEGEIEEIRQIFKSKGFEGEALETAVNTIIENNTAWIGMMLVEEYGLTKNHPNAMKAALNTFLAFLLCGAMPILPFLLYLPHSFLISIILSGFTFFAIGAIKSYWSLKSWWWHGVETFIIGMAAALIAFGTGYGLRILGIFSA